MINGLPSLAEIEATNVDHLTGLADYLTAQAERIKRCFTEAHEIMGSVPWQGQGYNAAYARTDGDQVIATGAAEERIAAAAIARRGAENMLLAKAAALTGAAEGRAAGFEVRQDLIVNAHTPGRPWEEAVRLQPQANEISAKIRAQAASMAFIDQDTTTKLTTATASFGTLKFTEAPIYTGGEPFETKRNETHLVDWRQGGPTEPGGGYGSYHYGYEFSTPEGWTKEQIMAEVQKNFNKYFTFTANENEIVDGAKINLKGPFGEDEPVQVTNVTPNSFSFVSLPGHSEGSGRVIKFSIVPAPTSPVPGRLNWELQVAASGPLSKGSLIPGASLANKAIWQVFANNLISRLPHTPQVVSTR